MYGHHFITTHHEQRVRVAIGFSRASRGPFPDDVPIGKTPDYIFMYVEPIDDDGEGGDDLIYNSLTDPEAGTSCTDVTYYRSILAGLKITIPESMFQETQRDQAARTTNRSIEHFMPQDDSNR